MNTVTIDERDGEVILHVKYGESICSDCHTRQLVDSLNKELDVWRKKASALEDERDELKAKFATPRVDCFKCTHKDRLADAERCIEEIYESWKEWNIAKISPGEALAFINSSIRAYREKKGGAK